MSRVQETSRTSLDSEPDLVAFDGSSILPGGGAGYSYGPSTSPMSRRSSENVNIDMQGSTSASTTAAHAISSPPSTTTTSSPAFLNRSRARASSLASKLSGSTLPLYSERDAPVASTSTSTPTTTTSPGRLTREHSGAYRRSASEHSESSDDGDDDYDDDYEDDDDEDEDDNSLEMDTLNKNSGGKGGWKMVANTDKYGNTPTSATFLPTAMIVGSSSRLSLAIEETSKEKVHKSHSATGKKGPHSRFEPFGKVEWIAMVTSLVLVTILTVLSLHICFSG